jgi:hypothetical protein
MDDTEGGFLPLAYTLAQMVPVRKNFSSADKAFIQAYGGFPINRMTVCRAPVSKVIEGGLNMLTLGAWQRAKARYGYDAMFHLFLLIDIVDTSRGGKIITACLEKNETPRCYLYNVPMARDTEIIYIQKQYTGNLRSALDATIAQMGTSFWVYTAFKNNCQDFLIQFLGANGLLTPNVVTFIKQDIASIVRELPTYVQPVANFITNTARRIRTFFGRGLEGLN